MFIETSSPRKPNDKARLESEEFQPTGSSGRCLKFWYHMYGNTIGTLNIWMSSNGTSGRIWSLTGNQQNQWRFGQAPVSSPGVYQVSKVVHFETCACMPGDTEINEKKVSFSANEGLSGIMKQTLETNFSNGT